MSNASKVMKLFKKGMADVGIKDSDDLPPMYEDCVHQDCQHKSSDAYTDLLILKCETYSGYEECMKIHALQSMGVKQSYCSNICYPKELDKKYRILYLNCTLHMYEKECPRRMWVSGLCKTCTHHIYKKTKCSQSLFKNIFTITKTLNFNNKNKTQISQRKFKYLWMNLLFLQICLMHPQIGIHIIKDKQNTIFLSLIQCLRCITKYLRHMKKRKKFQWTNFNPNIHVSPPIIEAIAMMNRFLLTLSKYLYIFDFDKCNREYVLRLLQQKEYMEQTIDGLSSIIHRKSPSDSRYTFEWIEILDIQSGSMRLARLIPFRMAFDRIHFAPKKRQKVDKQMKNNFHKIMKRKQCGWFKCVRIRETKINRKWYICKNCMTVCYCDRKCQKYDWKYGLHKRYCNFFASY
eukprot:486311_1